MPKEVLRSGASTPAAPVAAPVAQSPIDLKLAEMRTRLEVMALAPELVNAAIAAEKVKLEKELGAASPAAPVTPPPPPKPVASTKPKAEPKNVTPPKAEPAAAPASDAEANEQLRRAYVEDHGGPSEEESAAAEGNPGAEPDTGHVDDDSDPGTVVVQNHWTSASEGAITGPVDRSDFKTPQLKLVQGNGPLSKQFNQGSLIFMDQVIFGPPDPQKGSPIIKFIPVTIAKYFRENVKRLENPPPGYVSPQPRNAQTPDQVKALGGTTEFGIDRAGNRIKPSWAPAARCTVIIERPEGIEHPGFSIPVEIGGVVRYFAPAIFFVNGGQYRAFIKPLMDATTFILCEGTGENKRIVLDKRLWKMQVIKEQSGENMVFNPKIEMINELTPPDLKDLAKSLR